MRMSNKKCTFFSFNFHAKKCVATQKLCIYNTNLQGHGEKEQVLVQSRNSMA